MRRPRISWLVLIAAAVTVLAVPGLREQARAIPSSAVRGLWSEDFFYDPSAVRQVAAFVDRHSPNDPDMLQAVGTMALIAEPDPWSSEAELVSDEPAWIARTFLERAAEADGTPAAWAAYSQLRLLARWYTIGPDDPGWVPPEPGRPAGWGAAALPDPPPRVSDPQTRVHILAALRGWRAIDPENAFPVAMEALQLEALGREEEARSLWQAAGTMPVISDRSTERRDAFSLLLQRMGSPEMEAIGAAVYVDENGLWSLPLDLLIGAQAISRAGIEAASQGRPEEAVRLWQATIDLGRRMQMSADSSGQFQNGASLERTGADPIWQLYPEYHVGMSDEEKRGRSFWYGRHHALYVEHMGEEADAALRDHLVKNHARFSLLSGPFSADTELSGMKGQAETSLRHFVFLALSTGLLLVLFGLLSLYAREAADRAANIGLGWRAALVLVPLPLGYLLLLLLGVEPPSILPAWHLGRSPWFSAAAVPLAVLVLSLGSVLHRQAGSAGTWTVWRGNMRAVLPPVAALVAVLCVALGLDAAPVRAKATQELRRPELARVIEELGDSWHNPPIPPDPWRAEHPPGDTADDHIPPPL